MQRSVFLSTRDLRAALLSSSVFEFNASNVEGEHIWVVQYLCEWPNGVLLMQFEMFHFILYTFQVVKGNFCESIKHIQHLNVRTFLNSFR